jgi:SOS-response transcriptional repressor LexA
MTLDAVREAVHALQADGRYPSERAVMARLGSKSKRAIAAHLKALRDENPALFAQPVAPIAEPDPPPAPIREPTAAPPPPASKRASCIRLTPRATGSRAHPPSREPAGR